MSSQMVHFTVAVARDMMFASCIVTLIAMGASNDRGVITGMIAYLISSLSVQELNPKTRSINREEHQDFGHNN